MWHAHSLRSKWILKLSDEFLRMSSRLWCSGHDCSHRHPVVPLILVMVGRNPLKPKLKLTVKAKKSQLVKAATTANFKKDPPTQSTLAPALLKSSVNLNTSVIDNIISSFITDEVLVSVAMKKAAENLKRVDFVRLDNMKNSWAKLIRYLEIVLTTPLFTYLEDTVTEAVLKEWLNLRSSEFEVLSWEMRAWLKVSKLWMMLAYKWVLNLSFKILSLQPSDIEQNELNKVLTYAMIIHVMMCLIQTWLDVYHESADSAQEHQKVEMYVRYDWFRAFNILRAYYWDNTSVWFLPGQGCRLVNTVISLCWSQVAELAWGPVTIVTGMVNKSERYDDKIVKNDDEEKNIKVSDKLKARLNMMFEALREEEMNCFVKDTLKCSLLNQTTLSALCKELWKLVTVLFDESVLSTARV